ncbi:hypothetical protein [Clostridium sporogenes]|uniref:hypothetical protein n=1 Tax=Clostridium sporogenes TaxID=1509 RepID=UPI0007177039|nr:hypothetical protein [Clostridium sporogenes]KRU40005.1 putative plasmid protein [Clostridium sporogenes]MBY7065178.1 hypothetical protein [Clostridium sporogenes]MBY7071852.1 hypothetical protein [Clostridium sporogenes]MCW6064752.1 hypothetical protein [Clostridium sporogenes]OQP88521.1 putative plasmid protein [Clostridium sporogenes]
MNVLIRDVDPQYINLIDNKCKEISERTGKKFSRNDYLKQLLRTDSEIDLIDYKKHEFDLIIDKLIVALKEQSFELNDLNKTYKNVFEYMINNF